MIKKQTALSAAVLVLGFSSVSCQILLLREIFVRFQGNEISVGIVLGFWLIWTGCGSMLGGIFLNRRAISLSVLALSQWVFGLLAPATLLLIRFIPTIFKTVPGELLGLMSLISGTMLILAPFCLVSGGLFSIAVHVHRKLRNSETSGAVSSVYLLEVSGSALGGLVASLMLIPYLSPLALTLIVFVLNAIACYLLLSGTVPKRQTVVLFILMMMLLPLLIHLDERTRERIWKGYSIVETRQSRYGTLTVTRTGKQISLYQNGMIVASYPNRQAAEEGVHFALLFSENPKNILLVGGGLSGAVPESVKHPSVEQVDLVELDPVLLDIGRRYFSAALKDSGTSTQIRLIEDDGRHFIKNTTNRYDVVILSLPDPLTAHINRFYTMEFYREVFAKLNRGGILSFRISGAENYMPEHLQNTVQCLRKTLEAVFKHVYVLPGDPVHFFATNAALADFSAAYLIREIEERKLSLEYIREYYLPFRFMDDRMVQFESESRSSGPAVLNSDLRPIAYYYHFLYWGSRFYNIFASSLIIKAGIWIIGGGFIFTMILILVKARGNRQHYLKNIAGLAVVGMGFSVMSFQILMMLAFQSLYGYLYYELSLLIATFMLGMGAGTWLGLRRQRYGSVALSGIHLVIGVLPFILLSFFRIESGMPLFPIAGQILFLFVSMICGAAGGMQFTIVSRLYHMRDAKAGTGALYGLDLAGGFLGALLLSGFLIPLYGFMNAALMICALNIGIIFLVRKSDLQ